MFIKFDENHHDFCEILLNSSTPHRLRGTAWRKILQPSAPRDAAAKCPRDRWLGTAWRPILQPSARLIGKTIRIIGNSLENH